MQWDSVHSTSSKYSRHIWPGMTLFAFHTDDVSSRQCKLHKCNIDISLDCIACIDARMHWLALIRVPATLHCIALMQVTHPRAPYLIIPTLNGKLLLLRPSKVSLLHNTCQILSDRTNNLQSLGIQTFSMHRKSNEKLK